MTIQDRLRDYFLAGNPAISLETVEETRALGDIIAAARAAKKGVALWSATKGVRIVAEVENGEVSILPAPQEMQDTQDPLPALRVALADCVYVMCDLGAFPFDREPVLARAMFDFLVDAPPKGVTVVLLGPSFKAWPAIEKMVTVLPYDLPGPEDLRKVALGIAKSAGKAIAITDDVLRAASGLSVGEAENALALSIVETKGFDSSVINREKVNAVRRSGLLELVDPDPLGMASIGGLDEYKGWIAKRRRAFGPDAVKYGLPAPRGIMIVGVQGGGKSLAAKALGTALGIPTLRWDIASMFTSLVGASEQNTRAVFNIAEAIAPCVLWVEEVEKALAGAKGPSGDSGTTQRVFGSILTWLQERKKPVFMVMTANDISALPPELYRRGRLDEIFSVDLPNERDRYAIFNVVVKKYGRSMGVLEGEVDAEWFEGFTGSEIESAFTEAMYAAFDENREVTMNDVRAAAKKIVPLSVMAKAQVEAIRAWARQNARPASTPETVEVASVGSRKFN